MRKPFNRYNTLRAQNFETSWRCYLATIANHYVCCESTVGYPSDNLAFVLFLRYCSDCSSSATLEKRLLTEAMYRPTSVVTCFLCCKNMMFSGLSVDPFFSVLSVVPYLKNYSLSSALIRNDRLVHAR